MANSPIDPTLEKIIIGGARIYIVLAVFTFCIFFFFLTDTDCGKNTLCGKISQFVDKK